MEGEGGGAAPTEKGGLCVRVCARGDQQRGLLLLVGSIM